MRNDFRALCADLTEFVARLTKHYYEPAELLTRARAALADGPAVPIPPAALPEGYIDPEHSGDDRALLQTFYSACLAEGGTADEITLRGLRAVLADGPAVPDGREPASVAGQPRPVPVSERLPGPEDCDAEGRCWWGRNESDDWSADWTLATHEAVAEFCEFCPRTVWLPAHALPLPGQEVEG